MLVKYLVPGLVAVCAMLTTTNAMHRNGTSLAAVTLDLESASVALVGFCQKHIDNAGIVLSSTVCGSVSSYIDLAATGVVKKNLTWKLKTVKAKLETDLDLSIRNKLKVFFDASFYAKLKANIKLVIAKQCGQADDFNACLKTHASVIAKGVNKVSASSSRKIATAFKVKVDESISTVIDLNVKHFEVDFIIEKLTLDGSLKLKTAASTQIKAWLNTLTKDSVWVGALSKEILSLTV